MSFFVLFDENLLFFVLVLFVLSQPRHIYTTAISKIIESDRRASAKSIAEILGISDRTVRYIIHQDLGPQKIKGRLVSKLQTTYDKTTRKIYAENLLEKYEENWAQFKGRFITCDETWLMYEQPETKESAAEWRAPGEDPPLVPKIKNNKRKIMGVFFWDAEGIIMIDFVPASKSVTGKYYAELIHKLAAEVDDVDDVNNVKKVLCQESR